MGFDLINAATFAYVGYKQIRSPQRHLVILCSLFWTAALAVAAYDILLLTSNIILCVGHWKLVWQFFIGVIDTKSIIWNGISWHLKKISHYRILVDWIARAFKAISLLAPSPPICKLNNLRHWKISSGNSCVAVTTQPAQLQKWDQAEPQNDENQLAPL